ncbi:MAG TPA: amidophosphoribosyltransferase [Syntrophorhabdus sp.]|jgi:amidophosphoribosyltransferase|nr:amidophosphoribosyltransferase [Syntrophorhabdus sp.]OPX95725.1 MAG: Amidophosphoribosyltransferase precursor [Syntrophorhabdus sp. PtaB.Bin027]MBP8745001.1 amidophosphoribosyltransferase [Syntrophorhabdus sp.]NMC95001.1 amidophosphoribosyltransferase [Syntrophorhabdus sp.]HNS77353.1 amidophosphoribosyltransferase [Syntrophorhabdus sp.]
MSGIFGIVSKKNCASNLLYGTDYHSHMGTEYGGMAVLGKKFYRGIHNISKSQFKSRFFDEYKEMDGNFGIGVISDRDAQPLIIGSKFGTFAIVSAGLVENTNELAGELLAQGETFGEMSSGGINSVELIAKLINQGRTLIDGIEGLYDKISGSASILLMKEDGIYAARDRLGRTPLVVGERDGDYAIATETCSFLNLGFRIVKYLEPGEIIHIGKDGLEEKLQGNQTNQICSFLWIYTGYPASSYEGISVELVRERCGRLLARNDNVQADLVAGVPDSGVGHAIGYAMESGLPYRRPLVKYTPGYGRSYTPPAQEIRDLVATMKLLPVKEVIAGNRIVLCEDSIVRGTQLKKYTLKKLWEAGAKEIHVRPACPPLMFPCKFALSTRSLDELVARHAIRALEGFDKEDVSEYLDDRSDKYEKMVEWIGHMLDATTLRYLRINDMVEAIGLPRGKLCLHCWLGE